MGSDVCTSSWSYTEYFHRAKTNVFKIKMLIIFEVIFFIFIKMHLLIMTSVCVRMG